MSKIAFSLLASLSILFSLNLVEAQPDQPLAQEGMPYFPEVTGRNVDNQSYTLPQDFAGDYNIVLLAFTREQQLEVDTWLAELRDVERAEENIRVYELPTLPQLSWLERTQVDFWMSTGISDPLKRARTITLYTDIDRIKTALDISDTSASRVLLVDQTGEVYWQGQGAHTEAQFQALCDVVSMLQNRPYRK